jgi:hypothetical protein
VVVAAIGVFYLRPWHAFAPAPAHAPPQRLPMVQQLQFLSGSLGWVVIGRSNASSLYRTTDGAATGSTNSTAWRVRTGPSRSSMPDVEW